jgi:hypothetical protein
MFVSDPDLDFFLSRDWISGPRAKKNTGSGSATLAVSYGLSVSRNASVSSCSGRVGDGRWRVQRDDGVPVREALREDRSHPSQQASQVIRFILLTHKGHASFLAQGEDRYPPPQQAPQVIRLTHKGHVSFLAQRLLS